jgi:hypothetical protein
MSSVTMTVPTVEGTYTVRNCGSDRKPWLVERTGYTYPLAAFYEQHEAESYLLRALAKRGLVAVPARAHAA